MNTRASSKSLADVAQLTYFQIYKDESPEEHGAIAFFKNGNQQGPITVAVIAADANKNPVHLEESELRAALSLIQYRGGTPLPGGYAVTYNANRFKWIESAIPAADRPDHRRGRKLDIPAAAQTLTFYVSASPESAGVTVAARFEVTADLYFTTNPTGSGSNGETRDGDFDSSVEVHLAEPPRLSPADFGADINGVVTEHKVGASSYAYWVTEYYLDPRFNGRALPLLAVGAGASVGGASPVGSFGFYTHNDNSPSVRWAISYYSQPGNPNVDENGFPMKPLHSVSGVLPGKMYTDCIGHIEKPGDDRVVIGILKGNLAKDFQDASGDPVADARSTTMHILDGYGNDLTLTLSYNVNSNELTIG